MKKIKKYYIVIFSLIFLLGIFVVIIIYFPNLFKKSVIPKTVDVFGAPRIQNHQNFPTDKPKFTAVIGAIKPASVHQQSITVYEIGSKEKVFNRPFYADGFRGNELTYTLSSNSAEITQSGSIGALGCTDEHCSLLWSNYYKWDATQRTFVLNNTAHESEFQYLLAAYQAIDQKGCGSVSGNILPDQENLGFTQLYKKFPTAKYYCSNEQGILPTNILFFLQAEKALEKIVAGTNVGSGDIRAISM